MAESGPKKQCPSCGGEAGLVVSRAVDVFGCERCGLEFAEASGPVMGTPDEFFEGCRLSLAEREDMARDMVPRRKRLYEKMLGREVRKVLEVGCGDAAWAPAWREAGCEYTGVEYLPELAHSARERTGARILTGEFTALDLEQFDVAYCSQVLEHVAEPIAFLEKARRHCGLLHVDVPNHDSLVSTGRKLFHKREYGFIQPPHHLRAYTSRSLRAAMEMAGFEIRYSGGLRNDDPVLGQLVATPTFLHKLMYNASGLVGRGSLLVMIGLSAGRPGDGRSEQVRQSEGVAAAR